MKSLIVIPARLASTRLPEKLLLRETGKSVLQHTYEAAMQARIPCGIVVAVDHERILKEVESFGGRAIMTDPEAPSGTDRVAEIARQMPDIDAFINVQGDEPEIEGSAIDLVASLLVNHSEAKVATLATPIRSEADQKDPNCVKVVCDQFQRALYFSRSPIPYDRTNQFDWSKVEGGEENRAHAGNTPEKESAELSIAQLENPFLQHLGIYGYRREFLLSLNSLPSSPLEQLEKLEQLRFLQAGCTIMVGKVHHRTRGIDTLQDYQAFVSRHRGC